MQIGIVGPKASGKTTVFSALTGGAGIPASGGQSTKPNVGVIKVPDERIEKLSAIFQPKKTVFTDIKFIDLQGQEPKSGKGIDAQTVAEIRNVDAVVVVVRAFENPAVPHPANSINPSRDFQNYESELRITDFIQIENRLERMKKENKKGIEADVLERCKEHLEADRPLRTLALPESDLRAIAGFRFLSQRPLLVLVNTSEGESLDFADVAAQVKAAGGSLMTLCAKVEQEIAQLPPEEQKDFLAEMGIERPARERFVRAAYAMLDLISFFTVGEDEVRAWTIAKGTKAQQAAGKIHSDLERGFIRAEVVHYDDFLSVPSMAKAREKALLRQEGKEYLVKDGDIMEIKFNV